MNCRNFLSFGFAGRGLDVPGVDGVEGSEEDVFDFDAVMSWLM